MKWIPVSEKLPDCDDKWGMSKIVLCLDAKGRVGFGIFQNGEKQLYHAGWFTGGDVGVDSVTVTHWMPLPKPPVVNRMKYKKKPIVIEAVQYTGNNIVEVIRFMQERANGDKSRYLRYNAKKGEYFIPTLEGEHKLTEGDYVICGIKGEFYPCKPDIFEMTYDPFEE